jgi:hypothetical protein
MERALLSEEVEHQVISYIADGSDRGKFIHFDHHGEVTVIDRIHEYRLLEPRLPLVLKMHGSETQRSGQTCLSDSGPAAQFVARSLAEYEFVDLAPAVALCAGSVSHLGREPNDKSAQADESEDE